MANGRVVDIRARLDDNVKKGQLLFSVQSPDISGAFDTYVKAVADEQLANKAYLRAQDLYQHGAISQAMLEQAEDTEKDAEADLAAAEEQLKIFGVDKEHPSPIVKVYAPTSGVIVSQNITEAAATGVSLSGTATAFTIADLSSVWIICDVYENDLPKVTVGQEAQIKLTAYPDRILTGRVSDIGPVLDPTIRTAKVRIEVANPGILRLGMFVTTTLHEPHYGDARVGSGQRHPAPARSRMGVCARGPGTIQARGSDRRIDAARRRAGDSVGHYTRTAGSEGRSESSSHGRGAMKGAVIGEGWFSFFIPAPYYLFYSSRSTSSGRKPRMR